MSKTVYIIYTCDQWKTKSSMRLCAVCTTLKHVRRIVSAGIKNKAFSFDHEYGDSYATCAKTFRTAFDGATQIGGEDQVMDVLGRVDYAYVEPVIVNENPFV